MATPPTTTNHDLPLVPPLGDANAADYEDIWGGILNDEGWSRLDEKLIVRDTLANSSNYTPYSGALYWATDSGQPILEGDGSSWNTIDVEFADIVAAGVDATDLSAETASVSTAPSSSTDVARKSEIDSLDTSKLEASNYTPVSDVDAEVSVAASSVSGLDSAVDGNDSDISSLQTNKLDASSYTPIADVDGEISQAATNISGLDSQVSTNTSDISSLQTDKLDASNYNPEADTHTKYTDDEAVTAVESASGLNLAAGLDLSDDLTDGTTTIWDSSAGSILSSALEADSVSVAGRSVSLGGSTNIAHSDLTSVSEDQHHAKNHDHTEANISAIPNAGLSNSSVTVAGNSIALGGSSAIAHDDLNSIGTDDHHARDHDHSEQGISTIGNQGLTNYQITVAGNTIALGASKAIDHADLSTIGANDHHTAHEHPGDQAASSDINVNDNSLTNVVGISGQYASHSFDGSSYNIDLLDSSADARYRDTNSDTIIWFRDGGDVEVPNGQLYESGERVATRTYVDDNAGGISSTNFEIVENTATNSLDFNYIG
jgi:hypothetical protein